MPVSDPFLLHPDVDNSPCTENNSRSGSRKFCVLLPTCAKVQNFQAVSKHFPFGELAKISDAQRVRAGCDGGARAAHSRATCSGYTPGGTCRSSCVLISTAAAIRRISCIALFPLKIDHFSFSHYFIFSFLSERQVAFDMKVEFRLFGAIKPAVGTHGQHMILSQLISDIDGLHRSVTVITSVERQVALTLMPHLVVAHLIYNHLQQMHVRRQTWITVGTIVVQQYQPVVSAVAKLCRTRGVVE